MAVKLQSIVLLVLCCWAVFWILCVNETSTKTGQWTWAAPPSPSPSSPPSLPPSSRLPSRFLYLLQTESCLPHSLRSVKALGNSIACRCDVLVLSYKQRCNNTLPVHVKYISAGSPTSWNEGRNLII